MITQTSMSTVSLYRESYSLGKICCQRNICFCKIQSRWKNIFKPAQELKFLKHSWRSAYVVTQTSKVDSFINIELLHSIQKYKE